MDTIYRCACRKRIFWHSRVALCLSISLSFLSGLRSIVVTLFLIPIPPRCHRPTSQCQKLSAVRHWTVCRALTSEIYTMLAILGMLKNGCLELRFLSIIARIFGLFYMYPLKGQKLTVSKIVV